jgi:hypothetical protein
VNTSDAPPSKNNIFFYGYLRNHVDACIFNQCFLPSIIGHQGLEHFCQTPPPCFPLAREFCKLCANDKGKFPVTSHQLLVRHMQQAIQVHHCSIKHHTHIMRDGSQRYV